MSQQSAEPVISNGDAALTTTESAADIATDSSLVIDEATSFAPRKDNRRISQGGDLDPQGILSPETVSVKQRFIYARRMQEMREKERLNQVKLNPHETIRTARRSIYQAEGEEAKSPASKAFSDKLLDGVSSDKVWADTVQKMKQHQQERSHAMKGSTVAYSQELQQNRVVKQRISQWEALFIQTESSPEELAQIARIVKDHFRLFASTDLGLGEDSLDDSAAADVFLAKDNVIDNFTLGSTRVYSASTFGEQTLSYLRKSFQAKSKYLGLVSGVYSDKSYKPPLRVISMALRGDSGAFYIAVSIKPLVGHEDDANLLGTRKIVVFNPENTKEKLFEVSFNIVFTPERAAAEGDEDEVNVVDVHDCNSFNAFGALSRTASQRKSLGGVGAAHKFVVPEEYESSISTATVSPYIEREESAATERVFSDDKDVDPQALAVEDEEVATEEDKTQEGIAEEEEKLEEEDNAAAAAAVAAEVAAGLDVEEAEVAAEEVTVSASADNTEAAEEKVAQPESLTASNASAQGFLGELLSFENSATIKVALENVKSICSSNLYLIVQCSNQVTKNVLVSATSLKVMNVTSQNTVSNNQVYEWVRGVSASGWLAKFPSSMSVGRYQRRYFILQDNTLTYYKSKPSQEEFFNPHDYKSNVALHKTEEEEMEDPAHGFTVGGFYKGGKAMLLTDETKLELCLTMLQPTMKITTPSTNQTLLLRMKRGTDKEKYWLAALKKTIDMQARKRATQSPTIKTLWIHDNPTYRLLAIDVKTLSQSSSVKAALYFCEVPAHARRLQTEKMPRFVLDLDLGEEKLQLDLVQRDGSLFGKAMLSAVKIVGDVIVLSGEKGFVGVGVVKAFEEGKKKLVVESFPSLQHTKNISSVTVEKNLVLVADVARKISIWTVAAKDSSLLSCFDLQQADKENVFADERIVTLSFLRPHDESLALVSSTKRLLLLSIVDGIVTKFVELDRVKNVSSEQALFSLAYYETATLQQSVTQLRGPGARAKLNASMITAHHHHHHTEKIDKRFLFWKAVHEQENKNNEWAVSRVDLSEEKVLEALHQMQNVEQA